MLIACPLPIRLGGDVGTSSLKEQHQVQAKPSRVRPTGAFPYNELPAANIYICGLRGTRAKDSSATARLMRRN